ncbi:hypothetical protein Ahy_B05g079719 isoform A [Arachis hypogaea]|uniref:Uncharacterized protein n=1 Tax=Arachis hypogaea TaxID=3818 RepID=A0A444ZAQ9_ARAHY|nr:hypothetical protein Ahy_B05g079719 isoform A [Arachis hypogaea]
MLKTRRGVIPKLISQPHSLERNTWQSLSGGVRETRPSHRDLISEFDHMCRTPGLTPITQGKATWHYHTSTLPYWINPVDTQNLHYMNFTSAASFSTGKLPDQLVGSFNP